MLNSLSLVSCSIRAFSNSNLACILTFSSSICAANMSVDSIVRSSYASSFKICSSIICSIMILIISFFLMDLFTPNSSFFPIAIHSPFLNNSCFSEAGSLRKSSTPLHFCLSTSRAFSFSK